MFDPFKIDLPVTESIRDVREKLSAQNTLIVSAPPGAGKSTLLPLSLLDESWLQGKKIIMLEPRRLAGGTRKSRLATQAILRNQIAVVRSLTSFGMTASRKTPR